MDVKKVINDLKVFAKFNNFRIVFRDCKTNCGDFCIFIYKAKSKVKSNTKRNNRYLVGYDGNWNAKPNENDSFENCVKSAYNYIAGIY